MKFAITASDYHRLSGEKQKEFIEWLSEEIGGAWRMCKEVSVVDGKLTAVIYSGDRSSESTMRQQVRNDPPGWLDARH